MMDKYLVVDVDGARWMLGPEVLGKSPKLRQKLEQLRTWEVDFIKHVFDSGDEMNGILALGVIDAN